MDAPHDKTPMSTPENGSPTARYKQTKANSDRLEIAPFIQPNNQKQFALNKNHSPLKLDPTENTHDVQPTRIHTNNEQPTPYIRTIRNRTIKPKYDPDMFYY